MFYDSVFLIIYQMIKANPVYFTVGEWIEIQAMLCPFICFNANADLRFGAAACFIEISGRITQ